MYRDKADTLMELLMHYGCGHCFQDLVLGDTRRLKSVLKP